MNLVEWISDSHLETAKNQILATERPRANSPPHQISWPRHWIPRSAIRQRFDVQESPPSPLEYKAHHLVECPAGDVEEAVASLVAEVLH